MAPDTKERAPAAEVAHMLENAFIAALEPTHLWIEDESAQHAGHPEARRGGRHVHVHIVSAHFTGKSLVERHRMVYQAVAAHMGREVHAMRVQASSPLEWAPNASDFCTCLLCSRG